MQINPDIGECYRAWELVELDLSLIYFWFLATAMTGELSLVGQVLPVGGLKERILAAHRAGIKIILAPGANRADIEENVPKGVKTAMKFVYVEDIKEVLHKVFEGQAVTEWWKDTLSL